MNTAVQAGNGSAVQEPALQQRSWVPEAISAFIETTAAQTAAADAASIHRRIRQLVEQNREIHEFLCVNLNPASNVMNPKAERLLAAGLGTRASLGYPGDKYEMGLEAIEQIEVIAAELVAEIFKARYAEIRVPSGAIANLYAFMATCEPGDRIIVPPAQIGGHVTHHPAGAAGLYQLKIHEAPVDATGYSVDLEGLRTLALSIQPRLITIGGSLNLFPHPIREIRSIADEVGAIVLFDAAHLSGMIAGGTWPQPLAEGAHLMTMSTYKSLGGPPSGLIVSSDAAIAERLDRIAYPGLTANFDVSKSAALAITMLDWRVFGRAYAEAMQSCAKALAGNLDHAGIPVFAADRGYTQSHQFAVEAARFGGGQTAAKLLRRANLLTCGIGLPGPAVAGDLNGLRFGTPEIVRWGMTAADMSTLSDLIATVLSGKAAPESVAPVVTEFRRMFNTLHYIC